MPSVRSARQAQSFEPPPSSLLATHVTNGDNEHNLDQVSFNQLLKEALETDEHGQQNLGEDVVTNHKLICIIFKAGIEPILDDTDENPFHFNGVFGREQSQLALCLNVLRAAIEKNTEVLFVISKSGDSVVDRRETQLYVWLVPKLLNLISQYNDMDVNEDLLKILKTIFQADMSWFIATGASQMLEYTLRILSVLLSRAEHRGDSKPASKILLEENDFASALAPLKVNSQGLAGSLSFKNQGSLLFCIYHVLQLLPECGPNQKGLIQCQKQTRRFQTILEEILAEQPGAEYLERLLEKVDRLCTLSCTEIGARDDDIETSFWPESDRARKRPRLSIENETTCLKETTQQLLSRRATEALTGNGVTDLEGLSKVAPSHFRRLSEAEQCSALTLVGMTACQFSTENMVLSSCDICDAEIGDIDRHAADDSNSSEELLETLLALIRVIPGGSTARVVAMSSLRRVLLHTASGSGLSLGQSPAGQWCLQSLSSSSRDLRLAAIQTVQLYCLQHKLNTSLTRENRIVALDFLQNLWQTNQPDLQETTVLTLARVAQVVEDEELNIILLRLLEYLGSNNPYLSGLVYAEIQNLAQLLQQTVAGMLRPFWRTLAIVVTKSLLHHSVLTDHLCGLLGMKIDGLLLFIEEYALPYLIWNRQTDLIKRFAAAHGSKTSVYDACSQRKNFIAIMSYLLTQPSTEPEDTIMDLLMNVSEDFGGEDLAGWLGHDPIQIACEILKMIGDAGQGKASRSYHALQILAQLLYRKPGQSSASRRNDSTGSFLEANALAIVTHFTVLLNDLETKEPKAEKRRCLIALGEVVKLGKSRVVVALPQICACLRSAIEDTDLCDAAFVSWATVVRSLNKDELEVLVDQTIAIIIKSWDMLNTETQNHAYDLVADLLKNNTELVRQSFETIPSLASIPLMSKFEAEINKLKRQMDERHQLMAFISRLRDENILVIERALEELIPSLREKQDFLHRSILREQPDEFVSELARELLECCVKFNTNERVTQLCGQCLGSIGCLDSSRIENVQERRSILIMSNFGQAEETIDFIIFFLENVLVKAFRSAPSTRSQGFLAWAMQEFLKLSSTDDDLAARPRTSSNPVHRRWADLSEETRNTLSPFLNSKYLVQEIRPPEKCAYPLFTPDMQHWEWLRTITLDFLHRGPGENVRLIFAICCRIINGQDSSIPAFLLPYAALNLAVSGTHGDAQEITSEILHILQQSIAVQDRNVQERIKLCSQTIFEILDYMSRWVHQKRKQYSMALARSERGAADPLLENAFAQVRNVETILESIPPDLLSQRAIECKSFARALVHWEQFMRQSKEKYTNSQYERLQEIYSQIDEPDAIEGISAQMHIVDMEQQILEHRKSGRWTAAQSWYEMQLVERPDDTDAQKSLMDCLKESGQHDVLLHQFDGIATQNNLSYAHITPYAIEAAWVSGRWDKLAQYISAAAGDNFTINLGRVLLFLNQGNTSEGLKLIDHVHQSTASELAPNAITSLQSCQDTLLKLHVLEDVRSIAICSREDRIAQLKTLSDRIKILGSNVVGKQYLLGVRRAAMHINSDTFTKSDVAGAWLDSARLARKALSSTQAFNAVLRASSLGDKSATIEHAKLMWLDGHHRKAIQALEKAIDSGAFVAHNYVTEDSRITRATEQQDYQNEVTAKAYVLLGKWLDQAGQTQSEVIIKTFRKSTENFKRWEKNWYYLGRHYNKILDSEKSMPLGKESQAFLTGEAAKVVIENYLRSLMYGSKYVFQTLPKVLTLWLELVAGADQPQDPRRGSERFQSHNAAQRKRVIENINSYIKKSIDRIQAVVLYTILPQVVARICHTNQAVYNILVSIVVKVVRAFPQQALWTLLAVIKSQSKDRAGRGIAIANKVIDAPSKMAREISSSDFRSMIAAGQRFSDEVLRISEFTIEGKVSRVSLARDLGFNHKIAPSKLVVPSENCLIPSIPTSYEPSDLKTFRPFAKDPITISAFLDEALVLSSLQKPRKLSIRGSDGNIYGVLAKPKDDMRKDQRLMEFNTMINRFLKHDVEAAKRRLYIRTYAVIPLNEECGLIEWVNNLKTLREIVIRLYRDRSIVLEYNSLRALLDESCSGPPEKIQIFTDKVLSKFPAVFHEWFVESFPDPSAWFNARLRYTRSCAVMSIVGHALGLGDRHGENISFEEDNGGTLHVDFNCLFDKGLTFEKPECVPFRLTHNMVDAFGAYGYEGPFRRCCEITLTLLRGNEDALMTILETFLYDPTTDFIDKGKRKKHVNGVPDTPMEVLDGVRSKVRGMLQGESVPLSVGGYVEEMIKRATDPANLCRMYIGWCAFF